MGPLAILLPALAAVAVILWDRHHLRRTMEGLDQMLDRAIRGEPLDGPLDESRLSRLEAKLGHYLSSSALSARNVAREKDKLKGLIGDISHQTRIPLSNILLYAQLLSEEALTDRGRSCAAALEGQTQKLQSLIEALVKTSRLEAGVLTLSPAPNPLEPVLRRAVEQFSPKAAGKGLTLTLRPTAERALFDPKWTGEAVCNLLDNAVKYTPAGGAVTVEVTPYELFCRVSVTDTGPGIPEEEQAKVFRRFYRSPAVSQTEGVGVGLYLTRQIVQGQGGYVKVSSQPGKGAEFSLYLPRI